MPPLAIVLSVLFGSLLFSRKEESLMASEDIVQVVEETSAQPVETATTEEEQAEVAVAVAPRAWYARLGEDWLATAAGLVLVALLVFRVLRSIP